MLVADGAAVRYGRRHRLDWVAIALSPRSLQGERCSCTLRAGIKTPEQVLEMGIDKYNEECRAIVMRYAKEWEITVTRLGRWIDFENDYKTLNLSFMESVWWVFGQLWEKGLVYRGFKVRSHKGWVLTLHAWMPRMQDAVLWRQSGHPDLSRGCCEGILCASSTVLCACTPRVGHD